MITDHVEFPRVLRVRQKFPVTAPLHLRARLREGFARTRALEVLRPGAAVAIAVGSRGITNLAEVVRDIVDQVREAGARPFLIPAMGSHGGATPEGQRLILADYGLSEATLGLPVEASLDADCVGVTADGVEVFASVTARRADAVILVNRIKPHTDFSGSYGSGLLKMAVVGLGKHAGAMAFHRASHRVGYERALLTMARLVLEHTPVIAGVALLENHHHQTARVDVARPEDFERTEPEWVAEAAGMMSRIPFDPVDLLIVDRMGKNLSGTGMDPNVIGRQIHGYSLLPSEQKTRPLIRRLFVRDLTPESHGNAIGLGMADFTTTRLIRAVDLPVTYTNCITALSLQGAKLPIHFETDREVMAMALATLGLKDTRTARIVRIPDTLSLAELVVSEALGEELVGRGDLEPRGAWEPLRFTAQGNLEPEAL